MRFNSHFDVRCARLRIHRGRISVWTHRSAVFINRHELEARISMQLLITHAWFIRLIIEQTWRRTCCAHACSLIRKTDWKQHRIVWVEVEQTLLANSKSENMYFNPLRDYSILSSIKWFWRMEIDYFCPKRFIKISMYTMLSKYTVCIVFNRIKLMKAYTRCISYN